VALLGGLRALTAVIPNEHRAAVLLAFDVLAYAALSLPAPAGAPRPSPARVPDCVLSLRR
jgi:hypothetical protein